MADTITVKFKITEDGSLQQVANESKKAAKGLDKTAKSARTADRNLKGAAQASSNSSKNFSKMAQGLGGVVVPAYAAFAAQVFALTALFGFFKRAGDLTVLQQGQITYAASTGIAMRTLTEDIREATAAQVTFTDAAQAAAIGTAAGLTADQLTRLGKAAKDASAILGRDVTDSFNRLVRGVTKAEPELLDELGIILRLKDASEDYARALGKNANELTTFEKSQAVANNVLDQAERKYGKILALTGGGSLNQFNTLGAALDDVVISIQKFLLPVANAFAKVLTDVPVLAGASLLLLASGPLRAIGFSLKDAGDRASEMSVELALAAEGNTARMIALRTSINANVLSLREMAAAALAMNTASGAATGPLLSKLAGGSGDINAFQRGSLRTGIQGAKNQMKGANFTGFTSGMFAGRSVDYVTDFAKTFGEVDDELTELAGSAKEKLSGIDKSLNKTKSFFSGLGGSIASATSKLLFFAGIAGLVMTAGVLLKNAFDSIFPKIETEAEAAARRVEELQQRLVEVNEDFKDFVAFQRILDEGAEGTGAGFQRAAAAIGNYAKTLSSKEMDNAIKNFTEVQVSEAQTFFLPSVSGASVETKVAASNLNTPAQTQALIFFERLETRANDLNNTFQVTNAVTKFLSELRPASGSTIDPKTLKQSVIGLTELFNIMEALPKLAEENDKLTQTFENSLAPMSQAEQTFRGLKKEQEDLTKTRVGQGGFFTPDDIKRLAEIAKRTKLIKRSIDLENKSKLDNLKHTGKIAEINRNRNEVLKDIELKEANVSKTGEDIVNKTERRSILEAQIARQTKGATFEQQSKLNILKEEIRQLNAKETFQKT